MEDTKEILGRYSLVSKLLLSWCFLVSSSTPRPHIFLILKVMDYDEIRKRATIKLVPRIDLQAIAKKYVSLAFDDIIK